MASKKRGLQATRDRTKRSQSSPLVVDIVHLKRVRDSEFAASLIESMIDDLEAALRCVRRELKGVFEIVCNLTPKRGRIHIYLKAFDKRRKHAHIVVAVGAVNRVVSVTRYGRSWTA